MVYAVVVAVVVLKLVLKLVTYDVVVAVVVNEVGALGAAVSIVIDNAEEAEDVLPAASVAVAVME